MTERVGVIGRIRALAVGVAKAYAVQQTAIAASEQELSGPDMRRRLMDWALAIGLSDSDYDFGTNAERNSNYV